MIPMNMHTNMLRARHTLMNMKTPMSMKQKTMNYMPTTNMPRVRQLMVMRLFWHRRKPRPPVWWFRKYIRAYSAK